MKNWKLIVLIGVTAAVAAAGVFLFKVILVKSSENKLYSVKEKDDTVYEYAYKAFLTKDYDKAEKGFLEIAAKKEGEKSETALIKLSEIAESKGDLLKAKDLYKRFSEDFLDSKYISQVQKKMENIDIKILFSPEILDNAVQYEIMPNDSLTKISKQFNVTVELLRRCNNIKGDIIIPGRKLKVPKGVFSIYVDKSQNVLLLKRDGEIIKTYICSTGANNSTPVGTFKIEEKLVSPPWYKVGAIVPANSSEYELGTRWLGISMEGYGIHGTKDPNDIGKQITKGCVRLRNEDVEELYDIVPSGTEVEIVD